MNDGRNIRFIVVCAILWGIINNETRGLPLMDV
jgi:hypothetical protein